MLIALHIFILDYVQCKWRCSTKRHVSTLLGLIQIRKTSYIFKAIAFYAQTRVSHNIDEKHFTPNNRSFLQILYNCGLQSSRRNSV